MTVSVSRTEFSIFELETRMPFHFGNVEATEIPKIFLTADVVVDGTTEQGTAMGGLIPGWFYKDPTMRFVDGIANMIETFRSAAEIAETIDPESTAFAFWQSLYEEQRDWSRGTAHPPLLWSYGVSLVEQAVIDAVCRHDDEPFAAAVRNNTLGIEPGAIYDELAGADPADLLPAEPRRSTALRHTVGITDPLTDADLEATERLDDGLPQTLSDYAREDGVRYFKIKLSADRERDADRLARIVDVLDDLSVDDYRCSVDANEGYDSAAVFKRQWESHADRATIQPLFERLEYVEQPLARDDAFTAETRNVFTSWDDAPPIIIDESDGLLDRAGTALGYGYAGTSHKNCKGVFKGVINACLIAHRNRNDPDGEYVMSAEDLTTTGPIELLQDLAVTATIDAAHVERNGHQYFKGLDAFPAAVQERMLSAHGDLYREHEEGFPTLNVRDGELDLNSVVTAPFGVSPVFDTNQFVPLDDWMETVRHE